MKLQVFSLMLPDQVTLALFLSVLLQGLPAHINHHFAL